MNAREVCRETPGFLIFWGVFIAAQVIAYQITGL